MNEITQVYDEHVIKVQAAYAAFSSIYEAKNPKPIKTIIQRDVVSLLIVCALTVVMMASIVVSGSRTISEFGGAGIGTIAFVMIECGVVVYALFRARRNANPKRLQNTVKWATAGLILTFLIAVAANIDSTLKAHAISIDAGVLAIINLAVAISAPALAFISSDVLAIELMATDIQRREALRVYDEQCADWLDALNRSWNSQQSHWGISREVAHQPQLSDENSLNLIKNNQISSRNKPSPKLQKALDYLKEHPEHLETASRELEVLINGVSYGTINKAQVMIRQGYDG